LAAATAGSPCGPWRISDGRALTTALPIVCFGSLGLPSGADRRIASSPNRRRRSLSPRGVGRGASRQAPLSRLGCAKARADAPALPNLACPPSLRPLASAYPGEVDTGSPIRICADECAAVAQLVRAPDCGSGGRWFESTQLYQAPRDVVVRR